MRLTYFLLYLCIIILVFMGTTCGYVSPSFTFSRRVLSQKLYSTPADSASPTSVAPLVIPSVKSEIKVKLMQDMKDAMRNKEKQRLAAIRSVQAAVKQKEVDDRIELTDDMIIVIMTKLVKQRKESIASFTQEGRADLVEAEQIECDIIQQYLPKQLTEEELTIIITDCIEKVGAKTVKDMGKVMAIAKPLVMGKTDMGKLGEVVKKRLTTA